MDLFDNTAIELWGWFVAFSVVTTVVVLYVRSRFGTDKSIREELRELCKEFRDGIKVTRGEIKEVARGLSDLKDGVGDLRERVAKIEATLNTTDWNVDGDLVSRQRQPTRQGTA